MAAIIARSFIIYFLLLLFMRILGKRQLGQLEISEFVLAALAADMASHPLESLEIPLINGILPLICLFSVQILLVLLGLKAGRLREKIYGGPSILIREGRISEEMLRKNRLSLPELLSRLRNQGCWDPSEVQYCVLETDGSLSLLLYKSKAPPSAESCGLKLRSPGPGLSLIEDGRLLSGNLKLLGWDESLLSRKLSELGISSYKEVFFLSINGEKELYLIKKERNS